MSTRNNLVTQDEAVDFLNLCKNAYMLTLKESDNPDLVQQYRLEIRYWEDYLRVNWPEGRAKREPFGGKTEPMTREELSAASDQLFDRMTQIPKEAKTLNEIAAGIWDCMKMLAAIQDELIRKLPDEPRPDPARIV